MGILIHPLARVASGPSPLSGAEGESVNRRLVLVGSALAARIWCARARRGPVTPYTRRVRATMCPSSRMQKRSRSRNGNLDPPARAGGKQTVARIPVATGAGLKAGI